MSAHDEAAPSLARRSVPQNAPPAAAMLPGARALRAAGLLRPPGAASRTGAARRTRCGPGQRPVGRGVALPAGPDLRHFLRAAAARQPSQELPPEPGSALGAPKGLWVFVAGAVLVSRTPLLWPGCRVKGSHKARSDSRAPQPEQSGEDGFFGNFWGPEAVLMLEGVWFLGCKVVCVLPPWSWSESILLWHLPTVCTGPSVGLWFSLP